MRQMAIYIRTTSSVVYLTFLVAVASLAAGLGHSQPVAAAPQKDDGSANAYKKIVGTEYAADEVLVRLKPGKDKKDLQSALAKLKATSIEPVVKSSKKSKQDDAVFRWYRVKLPEDTKQKAPGAPLKSGKKTKQHVTKADQAAYNRLQAAVDQLSKESSLVDTASLSQTIKTDQVPNDPFYSSNKALPAGDLYGLHHINSAEAWDKSTGSGVVIADVDTGVDRNHPDIASNMWVNQGEIPNNGIDDDNNGYVDDYNGWDFANNDNDPMDDNGHGTHTAGTVAAVGNNNTGVIGVAWQSKVMAIKFLGSGGSGDDEGGANALVYAADNGAKISSNSWGGYEDSPILHDAIRYEHDRGISVIAAAGNDNSNTHYHFPSNYPEVISVGATDTQQKRAYFSNYGLQVTLFAPGVDILSLKAAQSPLCASHVVVDNDYCLVSGTSMATPHVAGAVGLILSAVHDLTPEQVRQALVTSATDLGAPGPDPEFGGGLLNASRAIDIAQSRPLAPQITAPTANSYVQVGKVDVFGSAAGENLVKYRLEIGQGVSPTSWQTLAESTKPIQNEQLGWYKVEDYPGVRSLRLVATNATGYEFYSLVTNISDDNQAPKVGFGDVRAASPSTAETISGSYKVVAQARDNKAIKRVLFYTTTANSFGVASTDPVIDTDPPYERVWDTTKEANGKLGQWVVAEDATGNIDYEFFYYNVQNADQASPTLNISGLDGGQTIHGTATYDIDAADERSLDRVEVLTDGKLEVTYRNAYLQPGATVRSVLPRSAHWDSKKYADGPHSLQIKAWDKAGNVTSKDVQLTVDNSNATDTAAPAKVTNLHLYGSYLSGDQHLIYLSWSGSPESDLAGYRAYRDGMQIADWNNEPYSIFSSSALDDVVEPSTTYTYTIYAVDTAGNLSEPSEITVTSDSHTPQPPTVPANFTAVPYGSTAVKLHWDPSTDDQYLLYYKVFANNYQVAAYTDSTLDTYSNREVLLPVDPGQTYVYQVGAQDGDNLFSVSAPSAPLTFAPDTSPPDKPYNVTSKEQWNRLDISWQMVGDNYGVAYYKILRNGQEIGRASDYQDNWSNPELSGKIVYRDNDVQPRQQYSYQIVSVDKSGNASAPSDARSFAYQPDKEPPTVPSSFSAQAVGYSRVDMTWNASSDNDSVKAYRILRNGVTLAETSALSYSDTTVNAGTTYRYKVVAIDNSGNLSSPSTEVAISIPLPPPPPDTTPPSIPANVVVAQATSTKVNVGWNASTDNKGVVRYDVYRNGTFLASTTTTTYADGGLQIGATYSYQVKAFDAAGNASALSSPATVTMRDIEAPTAASNLTAAISANKKSINLKWSAAQDNVGVTSYDVYRNGVKIGSTTQLTFSDSSITNKNSYTYYVVAKDAASNSSLQSNQVTVKT
jgi:subtilisin family serine protease/chitodextrinase